jgi:hypothetical protein
MSGASYTRRRPGGAAAAAAAASNNQGRTSGDEHLSWDRGGRDRERERGGVTNSILLAEPFDHST